MKSKHRSYCDSSAQTIEQDPDNHLQNFQLHQSLSIKSIQSDIPKASPKVVSILETPVQEAEFEDDDDDEEEEKLAFELQQRLNPRKQEDFVILQSELLQWRRREERKILITCGNAERKRELTKALLIKETCLLRKIEALKNEALCRAKTNRVKRSISEIVQPKTWETSNGQVTVETPETGLAREMKELHDDICKKVDSVPTRIDILQRIKVFLLRMHSTTTLAKDNIALVNRELEILQRDTSELGSDMLEGLRTRLANLFTKLVLKTNALGELQVIKPALLINKGSTHPILT